MSAFHPPGGRAQGERHCTAMQDGDENLLLPQKARPRLGTGPAAGIQAGIPAGARQEPEARAACSFGNPQLMGKKTRHATTAYSDHGVGWMLPVNKFTLLAPVAERRTRVIPKKTAGFSKTTHCCPLRRLQG